MPPHYRTPTLRHSRPGAGVRPLTQTGGDVASERNPWRAAMTRPVVRGFDLYEPADLEAGVKFFVLMLEQLGCRTFYSCEGHPCGFYVTFEAPLRTAQAIQGCG